MTDIITCQDLTKKYKDTTALDGISFALEPNKIYGLLGRNGAGKTTLLHLIHAEIRETSGRLLINGQPPYENEKVLEDLCFIKDSQNFKKSLKVKEVLELAAIFYKHWDPVYAMELIRQFNLSPSKKVKSLSKGMESALGIIVGLASRAPLTIFDEPYIGLDAVSRQLFYNLLIQDFMENPRTIVLSTHLIDEVSKIFEKIIIIDQGKLLLLEEVEGLRTKAFHLSGEHHKLDSFVQGKEIIHTESFGNQEVIGILGNISAEERKRAEELEVKIDVIPIQQLMIYLTTKPSKMHGFKKGEV